MDARLLFTKSITLLFLESQAEGDMSRTTKLIRDAISHIKLPDVQAGDSLERNVLVNLRSTVLWMLNNGSHHYDREDLMQRLRLNTTTDDTLFEAFQKGIIIYGDKEALSRAINTTRQFIIEFIGKEKLRDVLKRAHHKAAFGEANIGNWNDFIAKVVSELEVVDMGGPVEKDPAFIASVDLQVDGSLKNAFEDMLKRESSEGAIRTPWKALNRMMGGDGIRRGEWWCFPALPHMNKSGILVDLLIGACLFNKPFLFDQTKKPALVFYSSEDDVAIIVRKLFTVLMQREHKCVIRINEWTAAEQEAFVLEKLRVNGWHVFIHGVKPSMMTYRKYIAHMERYKADGYELCMVINDYISTWNKEGIPNDSTGDNVLLLHKYCREYTAANRIAHVTAHQLSTEAKSLRRMREEDFIQQLPGKGYYEGCKKLDTEFDGEVFINKRITSSGTYQEFMWGKHRSPNVAFEKDKYFTIKFNELPMYGLPYDYDLDVDISQKTAGGRGNSSDDWDAGNF